ncbi:glycocin F family RiPP peptide [Paenibacillus solani]|uniref:glycocin F family RiPP peptide n=1 Tax=Paenibacillus solani TaxID=1705565 RepID=UPI003D26F47F
MAQLKTFLSEEEIQEYSSEGKGFSKAECLYYLGLCSSGYDSGTCSFIFEQCGFNGGGNPPCSTCTCR